MLFADTERHGSPRCGSPPCECRGNDTKARPGQVNNGYMHPEPPAGGSPGGPGDGAPPRPPWGSRGLRPPRPGRVRNPVWYALVTRAERAGHEAAGDVHKAVPAWRRSTPGEHRWPVTDQRDHRDRPAAAAAGPAGPAPAAGLAAARARGRRARRPGHRQPGPHRAPGGVRALGQHRADPPDHRGQRGVRGPAHPGDHQGRPRNQLRGTPARLRGGHLGHQRDRVRPLVLGVRPGRPGAPGPRHVRVPGLPVPADDDRAYDRTRLGAAVR